MSMSGVLPSILPSGSRENTPFLSSSRSQAKVSVSQGSQRPVTSIANVNRGAISATSSINRPVTDSSGQKSDDLRYAYVQRMIKARKEKEARVAKFAGKPVAGKGAAGTTSKPPTAKEAMQKKFTLKMGTGVTFRRGLRGGLDKTLKRLIRVNRVTFKNISPKDREFISGIIAKHAQSRTTGAGYGWSDKRNMKMEIELARRTGKISLEDVRDFRKMIDLLA